MRLLDELPPLPSETGNSQGSSRQSQISEEEDHRRHTDENKALLVEESLARLRLLTEEIKEDDWKHVFRSNPPTRYRY